MHMVCKVIFWFIIYELKMPYSVFSCSAKHETGWIILFYIPYLQNRDHMFRGHGDTVDQLCWHPKNPDQLVTASGDKTVRIWDTRLNRSAATINTKGWDPCTVNYSDEVLGPTVNRIEQNSLITVVTCWMLLWKEWNRVDHMNSFLSVLWLW